MKLQKNKSGNEIYYYLADTVRIGNKVKTKNVERIGKHSDLIKICQDPEKYAIEYVDKVNKSLSNDVKKETLTINYSSPLAKSNSRICKSKEKNVGYFYLQKIYNDLKLREFFDELSLTNRFDYNANDINRFLAFSRILEPKSKLGSFSNFDKFYEDNNIKIHQIYRFLDLLSDNFDKYQAYLYTKSLKCIPRDTSVLYYDCTNYFFEIEKEDDNIYADDGSVLEYGFRKNGPSKEHRPNPLVQMGLFMDSNGIPLAMCLHHGSNNEQNTPIELEKKIIKDFKISKFIYCSDAGLASNDIRLFNTFSNRSFIVTQSVKKTTKEFKDIMFNDDGWKHKAINTSVNLSTFIKAIDNPSIFEKDSLSEILKTDTIYKEIYVEKPIDIGLTKSKNGKSVSDKAIFKQRIIVTFSKKYYLYKKQIIERQIEAAKKIIQNNKNETIRKGPNDVTRFIKNLKCDKDGVIIDTQKTIIDESKIADELRFCGFYAVATTLTDPVEDILKVNSKRWEIEESFRILKTNFEARPVFLQNKNRIIGHFMICYTSLLIYRIIEKKLQFSFPDNNFTVDEIIESLKNMNVNVNIANSIFSAYTGCNLSDALESITEVGLNKEVYRNKDIKNILKNISK